MSQKTQAHKQKMYEKYTKDVKNKEERQHRIKQLRDEMSIVENQIEIAAKNEEKAAELTKQYKVLKKEYTFWTNHKRQLKALKH